MKKRTMEQYLEIIYILAERSKYAQTGEIARIMDIKSPSVSEMLQKLESEGLIKYELYKGARLTDKGLKIAQELQSKHKIIANFLILLGVNKDIAEIDACTIEHYISNKSMEKLTSFLDFIQNIQKSSCVLEFKSYLQNKKVE